MISYAHAGFRHLFFWFTRDGIFQVYLLKLIPTKNRMNRKLRRILYIYISIYPTSGKCAQLTGGYDWLII